MKSIDVLMLSSKKKNQKKSRFNQCQLNIRRIAYDIAKMTFHRRFDDTYLCLNYMFMQFISSSFVI